MREHIHTVYDRLQAKGFFNQPGNAGSIDSQTGQTIYKGPIPFPKMLYHPTGKKRVTSPEVTVPGPAGPTTVPAQYEIINKIVEDKASLEAALKDGWWEHPSDSFWAGLTPEEQEFVERPAKSAQTRISTLEQQLADMQKELEEARKSRIQNDEEEED